MDAWLHGGDPRFATAPMEKLASYTLDDARNWLNPELTGAYLELTIVGDFAIDTILFESKIPQAVAFVLWQTAGIRGNITEFRRLNILAEILSDRLREEIREKLGTAYSPNAGASGSDGLDNFGYLISESVGKPADLPVLLETLRREADELARKGATADELDRALKPTLGMLEKTLRDNSYWLNTVLSRSQAEPDKRDADYKSINLKEINTLAAKYLPSERAIQVSIKPAE